ncbi:unnamed protein product [Lactuca virosa]|uniref:Uncharacterized protein n=1 Tax=Lactuca virosa TaxID=75947 RepID=A0AAU9LKY9_9ASTR|nr:unnamed protein product [Lactuca virosa]
MLLGHIKAGVDVAAALSHYWCDLKDKVTGLALVQSPYGGTPIASDIMRESQIADKETRRIMELIVCRIIKGGHKVSSGSNILEKENSWIYYIVFLMVLSMVQNMKMNVGQFLARGRFPSSH